MASSAAVERSRDVEEGLLAAIIADPGATEPRLIYADYLQARNDPRGELIVVQYQRRDRPGNTELAARETELIEIVAKELVPPELPRAAIGKFVLGFVDEMVLTPKTVRVVRARHPELLDHPALRLVRELDFKAKHARTLRLVRDTPLFHSVRRLLFGSDYQTLSGPTLASIAKELPALTSLSLRCSTVAALAPLAPLSLEAFHLEMPQINFDGMRFMVEAPWPLVRLSFRVGWGNVEGVVAELAPLLTGASLASVRHLELAGPLPFIEILEGLAASGRVNTLDTLALSFDRLGDEDNHRLERLRVPFAKIKLVPVTPRSEWERTRSLQRIASLLHTQLQRAKDAVPYYEEALVTSPNDGSLRLSYARALRTVGRHADSLAACDTVIEKAGKSVTAFMLDTRHFALCDLGRRAEAVADLERAVQIDANYANGWNNLGVERRYAGNAVGAFAAFSRALELDANHGYARRNRGELLLELERPEEALPIFDALLAARPNDTGLLNLRAQALIELARLDEARAALDARLHDPSVHGRYGALVLRAHILQAIGDARAARADLDGVIRTTDCTSWLALAWLMRSLPDAAAFAEIVPDTAISPFEIADAVVDYAGRGRPADATALHDMTAVDRVDCAEIAIIAATLAGDRKLSHARARAIAAYTESLGAAFFREWWNTLATISRRVSGRLAEVDRRVIRTVANVTRGRRPRADLDAITRYGSG